MRNLRHSYYIWSLTELWLPGVNGDSLTVRYGTKRQWYPKPWPPAPPPILPSPKQLWLFYLGAGYFSPSLAKMLKIRSLLLTLRVG